MRRLAHRRGPTSWRRFGTTPPPPHHSFIFAFVCSILSKVLRENKTHLRYGFGRDDPSVSRLFTDAARTGSRHGCDGFGTGFCPCLTPPSSLRHQPSHAIVLRSVFPLRLGGEKKVSFGVRTNCWSWHRWHSASSTHGAVSGAASPSRRQRDPIISSASCWAHGGSHASHWWRPGTSRCLPQQHCISSRLRQPDQPVSRCRRLSCARQAHAVHLQCLHRHPAISPPPEDLC